MALPVLAVDPQDRPTLNRKNKDNNRNQVYDKEVRNDYKTIRSRGKRVETEETTGLKKKKKSCP